MSPHGGDGDGGGGGGGNGGDGGNGGNGGGDGGWNCTTKDAVPWEPLANEKACPKPGAAHSAPFQPSPNESVMLRVHVAPSSTTKGTLEVYGAPPLSVVPSEQLRPQPTSCANDPLEQVIVEKAVTRGGDGGDGGGRLGEGGGSHCDGTALAAIIASWTSNAYRFPCIDLSGRTSPRLTSVRSGPPRRPGEALQ